MKLLRAKMTKVSTFTALKYEQPNQAGIQSLREKVDSYFYLGGKQAVVLENRNGKEIAMLKASKVSGLAKIALIISYLTIFIPIIMLCAKLALRLSHSVTLINSNYNGPLKPLVKSIASASVLEISKPAVLQYQPESGNIRSKQKAAPSEISNPNHASVIDNPYVKKLLGKVESHIGRIHIKSFATFDTHEGSKIRIINCVYDHTIEIGDDDQRSLLIDGQKVIGSHHAAKDCYALAYRFQGKINIYYLNESEQLNDHNVVAELNQGQSFSLKTSGQVFPSAEIPLPNMLLSTSPQALLQVAISNKLDPQSVDVVQHPSLIKLKWQIEKRVKPFVIEACEVFTTVGNKKITVVNTKPRCNVQIGHWDKNGIIVNGKDINMGLPDANAHLVVYADQGKTHLYYLSEAELISGENDILVFEDNDPKVCVPSKSKEFYQATVAKCNTVGQQVAIKNPHILEMMKRVGKYLDEPMIYSYDTFETQCGATIRIANSTLQSIQVADDPDRTLLLNGQYTALTNGENDTSIFVYENCGHLYFYKKDDNKLIVDSMIGVLSAGKSLGKWFNPRQVYPFPIAPSTVLNPTDPQVVNNPHVQQVKAKVEGFTCKKFQIATFETFRTHGGTEIKIVNCVLGTKITVSEDPNRQILIDGKAVITNNHMHVYYFVFKYQNQIVLYRKEDAEALSGENLMFAGAPGGSVVKYLAKSIFPSDPAPSKVSQGNSLDVILILEKLEQKYKKPFLIQSNETYNSYDGYEFEIANTTTHKIQIAQDLNRTLLVDGEATSITFEANNTCLFAYDANGILCIYSKNAEAAVSDDNSVVSFQFRKPRVFKSKEIFGSIFPCRLFDPKSLFSDLPRYKEIKDRVEHFVGKRDVISHKVVEFSKDAKVSIANSTSTRNIDVSPTFELLLNGEPTTLKVKNKDAYIFVYEEGDHTYLYYLCDQDALNDANLVGFFVSQNVVGSWLTAESVFSDNHKKTYPTMRRLK